MAGCNTKRLNQVFCVSYLSMLYVILLCPRPISGGIKRWCCRTSLCLSGVSVCLMSICLSDVCQSRTSVGPKSRTERPRKMKIATEVAYVTWLRQHFQGQKVKGQGHRGGSIFWRPSRASILGVGGPDPLKICRGSEYVVTPWKCHSFIQNCCCITVS